MKKLIEERDYSKALMRDVFAIYRSVPHVTQLDQKIRFEMMQQIGALRAKEGVGGAELIPRAKV
jgi:hypothetical protein